MKTLATAIVAAAGLSAAMSAAEFKTVQGTMNLAPVNHCIASPQFGKAFAEATAKVSGYKIRIDYLQDFSSRQVPTTITVTVVGRVAEEPEKYAQAQFVLTARNSCFMIDDPAPAAVTPITQQQFVEFKEK